MFKAKFVGCKKTRSGDVGIFTPGNEYEIEVVDNASFYKTKDDNGAIVKFQYPDLFDLFDYVFERADSSVIADKTATLKYFIDGNIVTRDFFYKCLNEVTEAKKLGASCSVDFKINFE